MINWLTVLSQSQCSNFLSHIVIHIFSLVCFQFSTPWPNTVISKNGAKILSGRFRAVWLYFSRSATCREISVIWLTRMSLKASSILRTWKSLLFLLPSKRIRQHILKGTKGIEPTMKPRSTATKSAIKGPKQR